MIVPDKTIAVFPIIPTGGLTPFDGDFSKFLRPLNVDHKREWFDSHFYKCLPLSIGNMQGFVFSVPFNFTVFWNGGNTTDSIQISIDQDSVEFDSNNNNVSISSEFGYGIFTVHFPVSLRTPPGVNIMTIAPPNYPVPGLSPMTGVVETDNLRFTFTLNFKIDLANVPITVVKDYPIMGLLPIPRYFCDSFNLQYANDIFEEDIINEEMQVMLENTMSRNTMINKNINKPDRLYYNGMDVRRNKFKDHQLPIKKNN